jgi:hypothetical protein
MRVVVDRDVGHSPTVVVAPENCHTLRVPSQVSDFP